MKKVYSSPVMDWVEESDIVETHAPIVVGVLIVIVGVLIPSRGE